MKGFWEKELERALDLLKQGKGSSHRLARLYTELGNKDAAFAWLDKCVAERNSLLIFLRTDPVFDRLRGDPRFQVLLQRIGLG
ncbi:MAG TPA: hypothetical protein VN643_23670 [Pyrinomonadaceae bacterium]|nr:hypothetical protein [Pyrinomonadaceae bacterium]